MVMLLVLAAVAIGLVAALVVVHRHPAKSVEAKELSAYHEGLDALTRLEAQRLHPKHET
jgi:hypothetical protein